MIAKIPWKSLDKYAKFKEEQPLIKKWSDILTLNEILKPYLSQDEISHKCTAAYFSWMFLNLNIFFQFEFYLIVLIYMKWETSKNKLKSILLPKIVLLPSASNFKSF